MHDKSIGDVIKEYRTSANLTQSELASRLGVSPQIISQYERGIKKPKIETVAKIANALGVEITDFYWHSDIEQIEHIESTLSREYSAINELAISVAYKEYKLKREGVIITPDVRKNLISDAAPYFAKKFLISPKLITIDYQKAIAAIEHLYSEIQSDVDHTFIDDCAKQLNNAFEKLNEEGNRIAIERIEELTEIPKYRYRDSESEEDFPIEPDQK